MAENARTKPKAPAHGALTLMIIVAIVSAIVFALVFPRPATYFEMGGEVFLRLLQMVVVPLVMASVMSGILGMGDVRKLGRPGLSAIAYYLCTTILAVVTGLIVVNVIRPGDGLPAEIVVSAQEQGRAQMEEAGVEGTEDVTALEMARKLVLMMFTDNLLGSMVKSPPDLLPLIVFSIVFAAMLTTMGKEAETINNLVISINDALMTFIMLLMRFAPLGIFCLVTARFGKAVLEGQMIGLMQTQGKYMATVLVGLSIHALVSIPLILWVFTRRNPYRFIGQMSEAILTAFSTASSTATLPVSMECAENNAKVSKRATEFVLPLGATINMDGTALYEAAAAIFIAQAWAPFAPDFELTFASQVTIAITATLAAIGAAGIPEAGLITMLIVLNAVGLPLELIGLILPLDWLLDRFRTAVNAFGDAVGAAVVDRTFPEEA